jgi:hypothetical protein
MADSLRALLPKALETLQKELEGEAPLQAAIHVLKACSLYGALPAPSGPTEVEDAEIALKRKGFDRMLAALASDPSNAGFPRVSESRTRSGPFRP